MTDDYGYLHEAEDVWFVSEERRPCRMLWHMLRANGFRLHEDVFLVDRKGRIPIWQSRAAVSVYIYLGEQELYEQDGFWNRVRLRYLLATLPVACIDVFVDVASKLSAALSIPMRYRSQVITPEALRSELLQCALELRQKVGEPGSKDVRAFVELTHPRE